MKYEDMTTEQVAQVVEDAQSELLRRQNSKLLGDRLAEVQDEFRQAGLLPDKSETWEQPTEARDAFGRGDVVYWREGYRRAEAGFVVCDPDCDEHWSDYVEGQDDEGEDDPAEADGPEPKPWAADLGTLFEGELVSDEGKTYRVISSHATKKSWTPASMPGLFEEVSDHA